MIASADLVTEVFGVVGRFRRQLRRSAGRRLDSARLSEAQAELLWLVRVVLMHRGELRAVGTPAKLKSTVSPAATLEDVFRHYAASDLSQQTESAESFREIRSSRKVARSVG